MGDKLKEIHQKGQSPLKDLIIISSIAIFVFVIAIIFDAHEVIMKWARQYENWQVDELITMLIILSFTFVLFSVRWTKNLRHEISERKRTEEELKKHRDHLEELVEQRISEIKKVKGLLWENQKEAGKLAQENAVVAEIGRIISSTLNINEVYKRFAEEVQKLIPFDRILINTINIEKNTVINVYIAGKGIADREVGKVYPLEGSGNAEMVRTRSTLLIQTEDFNEYKECYPLLLSTFQAGFKSIMNVPLFSKGQIIGGLLLRSLTPYTYKDEDVRLAEKIGDQIAGTVVNAQLYLELKKTEQYLKESERQYRELFNDAPIGYHEIDTEGHITRVNQTELTMLGYTEEEMVGQPIWKLIGEEEKSRETVKAKLAGTLPPGHQFERTYQRKDGSPLPVLIEDRLLYDLEG